MRSYVPGSEYFAKASAMVFFTSIFARILWRYPYARAYRAALIESGHVCQTFLLAATSLGLAPFSVMALADSVIERDLGIDGISRIGTVRGRCRAASTGRRVGAARQGLESETPAQSKNEDEVNPEP